MSLPRALLSGLVAAGLASGCGDSTSSGGEITVLAATSLTDAFEEIGEAFTAATPDASVRFSFAGSSDLVTQLDQGAPADVFASADERNMVRLIEAGGTDGEPVVFATNRLQIITAPGNPERIAGVADLSRPDLIVITCAPEVPCGAYADEVFRNAGVTVTPSSYEENVRAVANKVTLGEADAGIVYATDVAAAGADADGVEIARDVNVVAEYPIVVTTGADTATAFVDFVLGDDGQAILARHGFAAPAGSG